MGLKSAEQVLTFDVMFIVLLGAYGIGTTNTSILPLSTLPSPKIAQFPGLMFCEITDLSCNAANLTSATGYIATAIFNLLGLLGYLIIEIVLFLNIILNIIFSPVFSSNGIPVVGFFFVALQIVVVGEVFRVLRGSPSGM